MPELEAVLFDLYDTLVWSDWTDQAGMLARRLEVSPEAVAAAYEELRDQRDGGTFADPGSVISAVVEYCGVESEGGLVAELVAWEAEHMAESVRLYEDSLPALRRLRAAGIGTGVVSNCSPSTRPVVDRLGLQEEAGVVVLSCEVGAAKPSPEIYRTALEGLDAAPESTLFVDDRPEYLEGAARLGLRTAQIVRTEATVEVSGAHDRVESLDDLLARLP